MSTSFESFITRWRDASGEERANKDTFFIELCHLLDVAPPDAKHGDPEKDRYVFEADVRVPHEGGITTTQKVDVYKAGCFLLEAKQGRNELSKKLSSAKRGTPAWAEAMNGAKGQALGYARMMDAPPPFLIVADLGYCFDLYASFDGTDHYRPFPNAQGSRIFVADLAKHAPLLRTIFTDPLSLDPARQSAKVTREVAEHLARLAQRLEKQGHASELVAKFLMRCLFTMFAEDVGLLPADPTTKKGLFTHALEQFWIPSPGSFAGGIEGLWRAMNAGTDFGFAGKLLRFNGGLFAQPSALPLGDHELRLMLVAATCNWSDVEPAIFGTLLERALDAKERHALGAHYTPRAYVERLVRPTIEEPLRADWDIVQAEVRQLVEADKLDAAKKAVRAFHQKLCKTRVLDPACGSGNFLYVSLDLFQRLESEVLAKLEGLGEKQQLLHAESIRVTPGQFLGIEKKPWAKEIAELVLWIGYLQHHVRTHGKASPPPEPVLQDYKNVECRDAVLAYDREELVTDERGNPVTRWDGETMKRSPVTGEPIPDETARVPVYRYVNPRKAEWPKADFIVGNPPYIGVRRVRLTLGDTYVDTLRRSYPEIPDTADLVMYWWARAAELTANRMVRRFGFITTNSIVQDYCRPILTQYIGEGGDLRLIFAIADHPWVEESDGAAVRVAMTVGERRNASNVAALLGKVDEGIESELRLSYTIVSNINPGLTSGADTRAVTALGANRGICFQGVVPAGDGFKLSSSDLQSLGISPDALPSTVRRYMIGRDIVQRPQDRWIIDFFGMDEKQARKRFPSPYQRLLDRVYPERKENKRAAYRDRWWVFAEPRPAMRKALFELRRFIATPYTAKYRPFVFVDGSTIPDAMAYAIATDDAGLLGILSSRLHVRWAMSSGGRLGVGNDPRYTSTRCFEPFPFPAPTDAQAARIRELGEQLDAHRKRQQAQHPTLTITGMYNVLEKLRSGEALTAKEKVIHEQGLVSVLKQIHDDLDRAVFDAYGWPHDLDDEQILEKLVALNAERAEEEKNGLVRWLRPDFQNPSGAKAAAQIAMPGADAEEDDDEAGAETAPAATQTAWPKKLPEQITVVRDLVLQGGAWTAKQVADRFRGVSEKGIGPLLDTLTSLGMVVTYEAGGVRRWRAARVG